jgi:hypothetical protein
MATTKSASKGGGKGLSAAVTPSADLSKIVGNEPIPRSEVTKRVWDYIKANGLQDQTNKRMITGLDVRDDRPGEQAPQGVNRSTGIGVLNGRRKPSVLFCTEIGRK